jgi:hypothetical protein
MELITPFDFAEMFPEDRTMILVGNAPSLRGNGLGSWIDSFDTIVRFNECALEGYEVDVGSRTDILVTNPYPEKRRKPPVDGNATRAVLVIAPQTRRGDLETFRRWVGGNKVLFTFTPTLGGAPGLDHTKPLTTGTYALNLLSRILQPSDLACTGFTLFAGGASHHYWTDETPSGSARHDPDREAEIFIRVLNGVRARTTITAEIAWVAKRTGIALRKGIAVRPLPDSKWIEL